MSDSDLFASCGGCAGDPQNSARAAFETAIGRRTFLVQSALMSAAAALAACGAGVDNTAPNITAGTTINVNDYPALANVGGIAMVSAGGALLAIVRASSTDFVALSRVCPHQGGIVNQYNSGFLCPNHGAQFNSTGQWIGGQPTGSLHAYATSYNAATGVLSIS